jgi:hypothetical protein
MAYSKVMLKSISLFQAILNRKFKYLHMQTLLWVSFQHILTSLMSLLGIHNSMKMLYNNSFLAES